MHTNNEPMSLLDELKVFLVVLDEILNPKAAGGVPDENDCVEIFQSITTLAQSMGKGDYDSAVSIRDWKCTNKRILVQYANESDFNEFEKEVNKALKIIIDQETDKQSYFESTLKSVRLNQAIEAS